LAAISAIFCLRYNRKSAFSAYVLSELPRAECHLSFPKSCGSLLRGNNVDVRPRIRTNRSVPVDLTPCVILCRGSTRCWRLRYCCQCSSLCYHGPLKIASRQPFKVTCYLVYICRNLHRWRHPICLIPRKALNRRILNVPLPHSMKSSLSFVPTTRMYHRHAHRRR
jgi:hypothetical protein